MPEGEEKKILNTLAKGAGITAFGMFISKVFTYFYRAVVGRALGPEAYGMLTTGMMIGGIAATFAGDPVRNGLKKFIPEFKEENDWASIKGIVLSALQINFIGALLVGTVIFFSAEYLAVEIFNNRGLIPVIQVFGFLQLISRPYEIFIDTTIAFNKVKYKVISTNIIQPILQLIITVGLIFIGFNVMAAVWGWVGAIALTIPIAFYFMEKKVGPILTSNEKPKYNRKELFTFSYPLMLSGMIAVFLGWTDTAFLGYFMDQSAVGLYNAAFPTALILLIPAQALGTLSLTSYSELGAKGLNKEEALKTMTRWTFALTFPAFLIMMLYSSELLILLFGSKYESASLVLTILAIGKMFNSAMGHIGEVLTSSGKTNLVFYNTSLNFIFNVILNIYLIPIYGIAGAAIATAASSILINTLVALEVWRHHKINAFSKNMLKTGFSGLLSIGIIHATFNQIFDPAPYWSLIPAAIIFFLLYALIFLRTGGLKEYDREILFTLGEKIGYKKEVKNLIRILT